MYKIILPCPVCGSVTWEIIRDDNCPARFTCTDCGEICTVDEMEYQLIEQR